MSNPINAEVLQVIAGKIEAILIEQAEAIAYSYKTLNTLKISISVNLDPILDGVEVDYQISFPLEPKPEPVTKQVVKHHQKIGTAEAGLMALMQSGDVKSIHVVGSMEGQS